MKKKMMMIVAVIAMTQTAAAAPANNKLTRSNGFRCAPQNSLPSLEFKPGTVFVARQELGFIPVKNDTRIYDTYWEEDFMNPDGTQAITEKNAKRFIPYQGTSFELETDLKSGLDFVINEQKVGAYSAKISANASANSHVDIKGYVPNHWGYVLSLKDIEPIQQWFRKNRPDKEYPGKAFYVVSEVRVSDGVKFSISKNSLAKMGVDVSAANLGDIKANASLQSDGSMSLNEKYDQKLVFCYKADRLRL